MNSSRDITLCQVVSHDDVVATGFAYALRIATDRESGRYVIVDPHLTDGRWTVTLPRRWYGTTNRRSAADIRLVIDGRSRPDLLHIVQY